MEDKCFCHLNGYRVKDAEARNRIETLENAGFVDAAYVRSEIGKIELPDTEGINFGDYVRVDDFNALEQEQNVFFNNKIDSLDFGYHVVNLPLGTPITEANFGRVEIDLSTECLKPLEDFINKAFLSEIKKPVLKVVNSSYANGIYPAPTEVTYINSSTEVTHEQPTFLLFGITLQGESMLWKSTLTINGSWFETQDERAWTYVCSSAKMSIAEDEIDLTSYATTGYVNDTITSKLSGYSTNTYTQSSIGNALSNYNTKQEVSNLITNALKSYATNTALNGVELYNNTSGISGGSFTLSQSHTNFKYLEFTYKIINLDGNDCLYSTKVPVTTIKRINIQATYSSKKDTKIYANNCQCLLNGSTVTIEENYGMCLKPFNADESACNYGTANEIFILNVRGY